MVEVITAIYERGVLRPLEPLDLREQQTVRIQVLPEDDDADEGAKAIRILVAAGLMQSPPEGPPPADPVPAEERERLATLLGLAPGRQLSEIVIEDRGEW